MAMRDCFTGGGVAQPPIPAAKAIIRYLRRFMDPVPFSLVIAEVLRHVRELCEVECKPHVLAHDDCAGDERADAMDDQRGNVVHWLNEPDWVWQRLRLPLRCHGPLHTALRRSPRLFYQNDFERDT